MSTNNRSNEIEYTQKGQLRTQRIISAKKREADKKKYDWFTLVNDGKIKLFESRVKSLQNEIEKMYPLQLLIEAGEIHFVMREISKIKKPMIKAECLKKLLEQKGNDKICIEFIKTEIENLDDFNKSTIFLSFIEKNIQIKNYIKNQVKDLKDEEAKFRVLDALKRKGLQTKFVEEQLKTIKRIPENIYSQNEDEIEDDEYQEEVSYQEESEYQTAQILISKIDSDMNFVRKYFDDLGEYDKTRVLFEIAKRSENEDFIDEKWNSKLGDFNIPFNSLAFMNVVGCSEEEAQNVGENVRNGYIDFSNLIQNKAILQACGINIKDVMNDQQIMTMSPSVLYAKKKYCEENGYKVNIENLKSGEIGFKSDDTQKYRFKDENGKVLLDVVDEINKEINDRSQNEDEVVQVEESEQKNDEIEEITPQKQLILNFLKRKIMLSDASIEGLAQELKKYNYDIFQQNVEDDLMVKKEIFDMYGLRIQAFTPEHCNVLTIPLDVLYARMKFFNDKADEISSETIDETLGLDRNTFAQKYGSWFLDKKENEKEYDIQDVEEATIVNYPLPRKREEVFRNLEDERRRVERIEVEDIETEGWKKIFVQGIGTLKTPPTRKDVDTRIEEKKEILDEKTAETINLLHTTIANSDAYNSLIAPKIVSRGGTSRKGVKKVVYCAIYVNDSIILEPIGQLKNMTYIMSDKFVSNLMDEYKYTEGISEKDKMSDICNRTIRYLETKDREETKKKGIVYGIKHRANKESKSYNFETSISDLQWIIEHVVEDKEKFFKSLQKVKDDGLNYSELPRVKKYYLEGEQEEDKEL